MLKLGLFVHFLASVLSGAAAPASAPAGAQATYLAHCHVDYAARYPGAPGAEATCLQDGWPRAVAAGPAADIILGLAGQGTDVAAARARFPGASWSPRPAPGMLAQGRLGQWDVGLTGKAGAEEAQFIWSKVGELPPFDVPGALRVRGAVVTDVACQDFGGGEETHAYRVEAPGKPPFGLTIYGRTAPTANANSTYTVTLSLRAPAPSLTALRRGPNGSEWQARCS